MKFLIFTHEDSTNFILKNDGKTLWWLGLGQQDPDYVAWLADGNTPEAWNPDAITEPVVEPTTEPDTTTESVES